MTWTVHSSGNLPETTADRQAFVKDHVTVFLASRGWTITELTSIASPLRDYNYLCERDVDHWVDGADSRQQKWVFSGTTAGDYANYHYSGDPTDPYGDTIDTLSGNVGDSILPSSFSGAPYTYLISDQNDSWMLFVNGIVFACEFDGVYMREATTHFIPHHNPIPQTAVGVVAFTKVSSSNSSPLNCNGFGLPLPTSTAYSTESIITTNFLYTLTNAYYPHMMNNQNDVAFRRRGTTEHARGGYLSDDVIGDSSSSIGNVQYDGKYWIDLDLNESITLLIETGATAVNLT